MSITFLPLDLSGKVAKNRIVNESHALIRVAGKNNRVFVCDHGAFYASTVTLRDATNRALVKGVDYKATYHYGNLSEMTGKDIQGLVIITNLAVVSPVRITYQAVGGPFSISVKELKALLDQLAADDETFSFEEIIGKPTAYVPKPHSHEYWQLYGLESVVTEIDRITEARKVGTVAIERENATYGDSYLQQARDAIATYKVRVDQHINNMNNPHQTDKVKVGLNLLNNWGMSTDAQALNRANVTTYMPIAQVFNVLNAGAIPALNQHIGNLANPHGTTAGMAGCYTYTEVQARLTIKLKTFDAAADSTMWAGRVKANAINDIRYNLSATDVVSGRWAYNQVGLGYNPGISAYEYAMCGDGWWRDYTTLFAPFNTNRREIFNAGYFSDDGQIQNWLNTVHYSAPVGSLSFGHRYFRPTPDVGYWYLELWQKNAAAGGWVRWI